MTIPDDLWDAAKAKAARLGVELAGVQRGLLKGWVEETDNDDNNKQGEKMNTERNEVTSAGGVAIAMAELAKRCIGPEGTIFKVPAEDAPILRSAFISRLAEAAMKILDKEDFK